VQEEKEWQQTKSVTNVAKYVIQNYRSRTQGLEIELQTGTIKQSIVAAAGALTDYAVCTLSSLERGRGTALRALWAAFACICSAPGF
jgi:hypothetical protein